MFECRDFCEEACRRKRTGRNTDCNQASHQQQQPTVLHYYLNNPHLLNKIVKHIDHQSIQSFICPTMKTITTVNAIPIIKQNIISKLVDDDNSYNLIVSILFAILLSEALAIMLYRMMSTYCDSHFYNTFTSYTSLMYDLIDGNERPNLHLHQDLLEDRRLLIGKMLYTRKWVDEEDRGRVKMKKDESCWSNKLHTGSSGVVSTNQNIIIQPQQDRDGNACSSFTCPICLIELSTLFLY